MIVFLLYTAGIAALLYGAYKLTEPEEFSGPCDPIDDGFLYMADAEEKQDDPKRRTNHDKPL